MNTILNVEREIYYHESTKTFNFNSRYEWSNRKSRKILLKEFKKYKIGIDMKQSLEILKENNVINEEIFEFLNESRLFRNRISHRYKEPTREELIIFIHENIMNFYNTLKIMKSFILK